MDYKLIHDSIINNARLKNRKKGGEIYYESHHIIPKCLGGSNDKDNLQISYRNICKYCQGYRKPRNKKYTWKYEKD